MVSEMKVTEKERDLIHHDLMYCGTGLQQERARSTIWTNMPLVAY
jgi:hypothetical protein